MARNLLVIALLSLIAAPACAQSPGSLRRAKEFFERGETHYRLGNFQDALSSYQAALKQAQRSSIIFNIAQCHRQLGRLNKSLFYYRLYLADWERQHPGKPPPYYAEVRGHIKRMARTLKRRRSRAAKVPSDWQLTGMLQLDGLPIGARVYVDGALRGRAPIKHAMEVSTGTHRVTIEAAGAEPWGATLKVRSGETTRHRVLLVMAKRERNSVWLGLGIAAAVVAVGAEVMALVYTVKANDVARNSPDFDTYRGAAIGGHVTAGLFAATSAVSFVLYYYSGEKRAVHTAGVGFFPTPGGGLISGAFRF